MQRDYAYLDFTLSLCPECLRRVDAKIIARDGKVYMDKRCPEHGRHRVLIAGDAEYYQRSRSILRHSDMPRMFQTETLHGCPFDCGLCPDHEQHSCLSIVEITDRCNLECPTCYSASGPHAGRHRTMAEIEAMLDGVVKSEGEPDIVQISGGEPTVHPEFMDVLRAAKRRPIRHLMVNTNGIRIARDGDFARRLAEFAPGFEIYLQFDSLREQPLRTLRGEDLRDVRMRALDALDEVGLATTLVVTLQKGLNTDEMGEIIDFALTRPCVRGVTFQPTQIAGRLKDFDPAVHRLTLTDTRDEILRQSALFKPADIIPVPCNPDCLAMAYAVKLNGKVVPLSELVEPEDLLKDAGNTIVFEREPGMREKALELFSLSSQGEGGASRLHKLFCCLPGISAPELKYENIFRVVIMQFLDAWNFDVRAVKRSCVHMALPDGRLIPFDTMNLLYREALTPAGGRA